MFATIIKRDGRAVAYDRSKIEVAIEKAMEAGGRKNAGQAQRLAELAEEKLTEKFIDRDPGVEDIQDVVEQVLMENGYALIAKRYILYRAQRTRAREMNTHLMRTYDATASGITPMSMAIPPWAPCCNTARRAPRTITRNIF